MTRLTSDRSSEILAGVLRLVADSGYDKVTMDEIASVTHSSKATLYRQWGTKQDIVLAALLDLADKPTHRDVVDTGSLLGDIDALTDQATEPPDVMAALIYAMRRDERLAVAFRETVLPRLQFPVDSILRNAVKRGELAADSPLFRYFIAVMAAPRIWSWVILGGVDSQYVREYVDVVVRPLIRAYTHPDFQNKEP